MSVGVQRLRDEPALVRRGALDKGEDPALVDVAIALDERRRSVLAANDALKADRNAASKRVGEAIRGGADPNGPAVADLKRASTEVADRIAALDAELGEVESQLEEAMLRIPNPADPAVPVGGEEARQILRSWGDELPREDRRPHWELGEQLGIIDNA
ncbi:MAG: serine--tRNA ligase, partial [Chloroflexota bacterium]